MNSLRFFLLVVTACCWVHSASLFADDLASPFGTSKQFSADMIITTQDGRTMTQKMFLDTGKMRTEINANGMQIVSIVRPDQQKVYSVMVAQKMVMMMPYDPEKYKNLAAAGPHGKTETVGPDTIDGEVCTKYKVTSDKDNKVMFYWIDAVTKAPVKMMAEDNSVNILWKNYQAGPQDPSLFEPPADYKTMTMPGAPGGSGQ